MSKQYLKLMGSNSISYNILASGDTVDALKTFFSEQCRKGPRSNDFFFPQLNLDTRTCTQKLYYPERKCGCYTCIG